jgi:hypothetical protein
MFAESGQMQIEARYEQEDGSIVVKYIEVNQDALDYITVMENYIDWLQDEVFKKEAKPMRIMLSASSPISAN